ncbi:hypothetical protein WKV44_00235 [Spirochaetia bacterium 38H-sp]|uniref:Type II toxin-antitoxin system prevent-host-death family antitoxin n=1 Tax=Rarispira pelagica TaxID=3141764 RepID=A0ABU9U8I1_9SPIR
MFAIDKKKAGEIFEELVDKALKGEDVVITDDKLPLVRFVPVQVTASDRNLGGADGLIVYMADDFNEPVRDLFKEYIP